ncbi:ribosomal protein RPL35A [Cardiosporidium cionae]|uniref:Ribosomal protein RPL35A n=1 Tax=Cardiosporidium cionae TaxID=476202 RepID=A0ABQ7JAI0_9APIC|nr:ribosomal protein RPL35A [Cardiosporidium cionae]|eukprot:KAF8820965.1 ribosomal protein RPL35A [Cardiosporidium cionae]
MTVSRPRLYCRAAILGYRRSKTNQYPSCSLLQIEGVKDREDTGFYLGKRVAYIYKAKRTMRESKYRVVWGRISRPHGNSGVVRAKFAKNLPPHSFGGRARVFLYPSSV